jgi:antitoxin (DNA-binding transcriptional repressor) of toxin-antitoxin stability system
MTWSTATFSGYAGDHVRYAKATGASATITFTGKGIAWIGPVGPTRGRARIFIDGRAVATIDLRRSTFRARALLYAKAFPSGGKHTMKIVVTSSGRPVAIDEIIVGT